MDSATRTSLAQGGSASPAGEGREARQHLEKLLSSPKIRVYQHEYRFWPAYCFLWWREGQVKSNCVNRHQSQDLVPGHRGHQLTFSNQEWHLANRSASSLHAGRVATLEQQEAFQISSGVWTSMQGTGRVWGKDLCHLLCHSAWISPGTLAESITIKTKQNNNNITVKFKNPHLTLIPLEWQMGSEGRMFSSGST